MDDDPAGRALLTDVLERAGYQVETAVGAADATRRVRERPYRLVVADVGPDPLTGAAAVAQLTRTRPGLQALLVSPFPDQAMRARARLLGMPLLAKPFRAETLLALVQDLDPHDEERRVAR